MTSNGNSGSSGSIPSTSLKGKRVIFVIGTFTLGGAERQALLLARHLAHEVGADVEFWGLGEPGRFSELCDEYKIKWRSAPVPLPWHPHRIPQLKNLVRFALALRRAKPDVILPFMFFPSVVCGIVWRVTGAKICIWNQRCEGRDRLGRRAEDLAIKFTPLYVANSGLGGEFMTDKLGAAHDRLHIIYNGVDLKPAVWTRQQWREHLRISEECFVGCMVANLHEFKDHPTLLRAWRIVLDRLQPLGRDAVLVLPGAFFGTEINLKALAFDLGLRNNVRFLGGVKDVTGLLKAADLAIHSSVNEGVPNGVLEPMAAGLPVTGTDYPGIREAIGEQGYKFLAAPRDPEALAEKIIDFALSAELRSEAGAANKLRIQTEFPPRKMHEQMVSLILSGLSERAS